MISRGDTIQSLPVKAGLSPGLLRARNPRLITCDISGYGQTGPYTDMKAYDLILQCETGLASVTGSPVEPGRVGVSVCDIAFGSLNSVADFARHPQLQRMTVQSNSDSVELVAPPGDHSQAPCTSVPLLGQHNRAIRREFAGESV